MPLESTGRLSGRFDPRLRRLFSQVEEAIPTPGDPGEAIGVVDGEIVLRLGPGEPFDQDATGLLLVLADNTLEEAPGGLRINPDLYVFNEVPAGVIDGVNDTFTLAHTPAAGSLRLHHQGVLMREGLGFDYTLGGVGNTTITFVAGAIPVTDANLLAHYTRSL